LGLATAGYHVAVNYAQNRDAALGTCSEIEKKARSAIPIQGDIALAADRVRILSESEAALGPISLLVNNAGVAPSVRADILEADEESFDRLIRTNLRGPYFLTQLIARRMIEWQRAGQIEKPKIVFITSISAFAASVNRGDYCVSKAGLSMTVKLFAARLAEEGIGVYEIQPGIIHTDMTSKVRDRYDDLIHAKGLLPIPRWGEPEDVAQAVVAVARGHFAYSTGISICVDGGFHLRVL
jgi:NAD(P)-dependent dehydrogenase (short-subunit alcohol dehydrogenase family)